MEEDIQTRIELGDIKDSAAELTTFLEAKARAKTTREGDAIIIENLAGAKVKMDTLKAYLRRFLHSKGLSSSYRIRVARRTVTFESLGEEEKEE